ncbi:MAG: hypothetical protein ABIH59_00070 [archaeon]
MKKEELKRFFSEFWEIDSSKVTENLKIDDSSIKNSNSLRFYQFISAVESNFNVKFKDIHNILTFRDLIKNIQ